LKEGGILSTETVRGTGKLGTERQDVCNGRGQERERSL